MKISVIIPTYNAEKLLLKLLSSLKKQNVIFELIIIDSSSTDGTISIAKNYTEHIITIPQHTFDHGGTRTIAAKEASGDIIVFLTQDALPVEENAIEELLKVFKREDVAAAYGKQIPYEETSPLGKHLRLFNYQEHSYIRTLKDRTKYGIKTAFFSNSFSAYRKSALKEIGWLHDGLIVGEDTYAVSKLLLKGYAVAYASKAVVYHSHSYSVIEEFQRYFDIGVFHKRQRWILDTFGKAEGEGGKYVKSEFNYLLKNHLYSYIPEFFVRNGMKFIGYKLGQSYEKLPKSVVRKLSMHTSWWQ